MATVGTTNLTLADWSKRRDPSGKTAMIIEALEERTPALQDAVTIEGNLPTGHRTTIRTSLPTGTWRQINAGVATEKSTTRQVTDAAGMLETYSEVDKVLADLSGDTAAFRWSEAQAFLSGLGNESERAIFLGNTSDIPEEPEGLDPRYNTLGTYCISAGGSGSDNRSIWLVTWGVNTCHLFFPKGSNAGIEAEDKGQVTITSAGDFGSTSRQFEGYRSHFKHHFGLSLRDERSVVRICNIDYSDMVGGTDPGFARLLIRAMNAVRGAPGRRVLYMPPSVKTWIDVARQDGGYQGRNLNMALTMGQWGGEPVTEFWGVPLRAVDALEANEATIS